MSFFDKINPFKKKDELGLPPLDSYGSNNDLALPQNNPMGHNLALPEGQGHAFDNDMNPMPQHNFSQNQNPYPHEQVNNQSPHGRPLDDHRMDMPIGDSLNQNRHDPYNVEHDYNNYAPNRYSRQNESENPLKKDIELISSKLDYLKASLEAINQRIANLEHLTKQEMNNNKRW